MDTVLSSPQEESEITEKLELRVMICGASLYSDSRRQFHVRTEW